MLKQGEENWKVCQGIADCLEDEREQHKVKHPLFQLISQRIYQIAAGYEDTNDSNYLRHDPIFKIICDKIPKMEAELLASQPTISRLENRITKQEIKRIRRFFVDKFLQNYSSDPEQIVLDIDGFDAYTHGHQQLSLFHGYYGHQIYFPVLINEAKSGYPLLLHLRPGNSHAGKGVLGLLRWLFWRLRKAWPSVKIILRGDGGFSLPEIMNLCEQKDIKYVFGFSKNAVLKRKINYLLDLARLQYFRTQDKARLLGARSLAPCDGAGSHPLFDDVYYAAKTWKAPRRIVMKAEWLKKGSNPRFLVTNLETEPQELYDNFYVQRGASSEHRIKELKLGINADRLSYHKFIVNQFRLFLCQAAYILMLELRASAEGTRLGMAQVSRLRETIIKIALKLLFL
ncbi:hypothetical protein cce_0105 [Crocosphaera subtropica ATCC 51142]|uniref:Transposase DDE domain-containing protein n=1 Tax=Crocosphaera subtropica (strain ATCC 51142 / BH68) TaxID=43989 RepID=B1WZ91_CROS5|nr:hypothetical protein cce_0105 [Crocosphaera subtropica ATCC 51142]